MSDEWSGQRPPPTVPQNVKPKMNEKGAGLRAPVRSRSISLERRGRRRERPRVERRRRGRSEEARGRHGKRVANERSRARRPAAGVEEEEEEEECAVCFCSYDNVFKAPKLLACGHTFCLECLARINVTSPDLTAVSCPVCREPTRLPHGRDLPRLDTNGDIIGRLPPGMRRALSVRFKRSKGKLLLKDPPIHGATAAELPVKSPPGGGGPVAEPPGGLHTGTVEGGVERPTVVDVGRPPGRVRGRLRRLLRSDRCYYAVVGSIITITVTLMLVGILAFIIIPRVPRAPRPPPQNQTGPA